MPISTSDMNSTASSPGGGAPEPIYINAVTIASLDPDPEGRREWMDLALEVTFEIGKDFQPSQVLGGALKRGPEGRPTGWGGAFKVAELFKTCDIDFELTPDEQIPAGALEELLGKKVLRLQYVHARKENGRLAYWTYDRFGKVVGPVAQPGEGEDAAEEQNAQEQNAQEQNAQEQEAIKDNFRATFLSDADQGYAKGYYPDVITQPGGGGGAQNEGNGILPGEDEQAFVSEEVPF